MRQECHKSKSVSFEEKILKVLKCYNFLWVQRRHNCSPAASFANCVMTLYLLKVHLQTFLSILVTKKCQILSSGTLIANERYMNVLPNVSGNLHKTLQTFLVSFLCKILNNLLKYLKLRSTKHKCNRIYTSKYKIVYEHGVPQLQ